jgi:hypothetical protein
MVASAALGDDEGAGKFALTIGFLITTSYVNIILIILNGNFLGWAKTLTANTDLTTYLTLFWV